MTKHAGDTGYQAVRLAGNKFCFGADDVKIIAWEDIVRHVPDNFRHKSAVVTALEALCIAQAKRGWLPLLVNQEFCFPRSQRDPARLTHCYLQVQSFRRTVQGALDSAACEALASASALNIVSAAVGKAVDYNYSLNHLLIRALRVSEAKQVAMAIEKDAPRLQAKQSARVQRSVPA